MAAKRKDLSKLSPDELKAYKARAAAAAAPKEAYIVYKMMDGNGDVLPGVTLKISHVTRNAKELVDLITKDRDLAYEQIMIK